MQPALGIIEGFYGPAWSWQARAGVISRLAPHGYHFYWYAPKGDAYLRRRWQDPHPAEQAAEMRAFARHCEDHGVAFGIGLSPYEVYRQFDGPARQALADKLAFLADLGVQRLALLFDDMPGDLPELAQRQAEVVDWVRARSALPDLAVCPTYYSDDPVLDRVFTPRPAGYLEQLGQLLDPAIEIFWTGEEVCSRAFSPAHVRQVAKRLGRRPLLWDNYPVNDGDRMSRHLHLRGFTGRPASLAGEVSGHAINPALQPTLTCIPAITLAASYRQGDDYCYLAATREAAREVLGPELGRQLCDDLLALEDSGLGRLSEERQARLRETYSGYDQDGAREVLAWLAGAYQVSDEMVQTQ